MTGFQTGQGANSREENRRAELERLRGSAAQYFKVYGEIQVTGAGEALTRIVFPVRFTEKPVLHHGSELAPGSPTVTAGSFPTCSASILTWDTRVKSDGTFLYIGGLFGIVTSGSVNQVMNVHWSIEGIGLRNPAAGDNG